MKEIDSYWKTKKGNPYRIDMFGLDANGNVEYCLEFTGDKLCWATEESMQNDESCSEDEFILSTID